MPPPRSTRPTSAAGDRASRDAAGLARRLTLQVNALGDRKCRPVYRERLTGPYDGLTELLGGPSDPGIGFAVGVERVVLLLGDRPDAAGAARPRCS